MKASIHQIFLIFLKLGLYCFGGPIAHLSFFHHEFVEKRKWIDEKTYGELVALCQSLPGPASSQIAITLGMQQHGLWGGVVAIIGFLLPSIAILTIAAYFLALFANVAELNSLHGIQIVVAAIIAQAIIAMGKRFCTGNIEISITIVAMIIALAFSTSFLGQIGAIVIGALAGGLFLRHKTTHTLPTARTSERMVALPTAVIAWVVFLLLLFGLPLINLVWHNSIIDVFNRFFQTGSFVFGGGHVVLPLLQTQFVTTGFVNSQDFLLGYGIAQAVPGPLFSFAAFIGTLIQGGHWGWLLGLLSVFAIYLPSWLILIGALPLWERWRHHRSFQATLAGVCAAVVGLLLAAFYNPIWTDTIHSATDFALTCLAFVLLDYWHWPQWLLVVGAAVIGFVV